MFQAGVGIAAGALILAACAGEGAVSDSIPGGTSSITTAPETFTSVEIPDGASGLQIYAGSSADAGTLPPPLIETDQLRRGQIPDGIPAIDEPQFVDVAAADEWLSDEEAVVVLNLDGDVRAYPAQILIWHEIVNDTVAGVPVSVTYCPLCNSAVTYERRFGDVLTTFGTSGLLFNSALVMYDRATESLWTHFDGRAVAGLSTGEQLRVIASPLVSWADFKESFPDGLVLDRDNTGYNRSYGSNPYGGYDNPTGNPFLFNGTVDDRLGEQQRVTGVRIGDASKAWTIESISGGDARVTEDQVNGIDIVIFWERGQASALDSSKIAEGRDVGSVGVFESGLNGEMVTFSVDGGQFVDDATGSTWNVFGEAIDGPLRGEVLAAVPHLDTFWFAWFSYNPDTDLVGG